MVLFAQQKATPLSEGPGRKEKRLLSNTFLIKIASSFFTGDLFLLFGNINLQHVSSMLGMNWHTSCRDKYITFFDMSFIFQYLFDISECIVSRNHGIIVKTSDSPNKA